MYKPAMLAIESLTPWWVRMGMQRLLELAMTRLRILINLKLHILLIQEQNIMDIKVYVILFYIN